MPKDKFQDYDITYVVTDMEPFKRDDKWFDVFGKRIILQTPEALSSTRAWQRFSYLMLVEDGSCIDLTLVP